MPIVPLAEMGPETLGIFIPILAVVSFIVMIMTKHQQRMAEIIHRNAPQQSSEEVTQLRHEVAELKQLIHEQMIALDSYAGTARRSEDAPIQRRLEQR